MKRTLLITALVANAALVASSLIPHPNETDFGTKAEGAVFLQSETTPRERYKVAIQWVNRIVAAPALGYGIYELYKDSDAYADWAFEITDKLYTWSAQKTHDYTARALEMGLGPFVDRMRQTLGRRDDFPLLEGRDHVLRRAEDHLSERLGVEVRHVGFWDRSMPGQPMKREENEEGQDPETNHAVIKLGNGPGPQTTQNERRLQGRTAKYNAQVFDRGGIDGIGNLTSTATVASNWTLATRSTSNGFATS
ncbi:hypothetical protein DL771_004959 [Monosporascus sp. 5C6A]|nr:hypothetical protein DL771_004959 [Monosporascus sp. 5C6A]